MDPKAPCAPRTEFPGSKVLGQGLNGCGTSGRGETTAPKLLSAFAPEVYVPHSAGDLQLDSSSCNRQRSQNHQF